MTDREAFEEWIAHCDVCRPVGGDALAWDAWKAATLAERARAEKLDEPDLTLAYMAGYEKGKSAGGLT